MALDTRRAYTIGSPPRDTSPPGKVSRDRLRRARDRQDGILPSAGTPNKSQSILPVSPFVVVLCPAPPVSTPTTPSLPCKDDDQLPPAPTQATLPDYGVSITSPTRRGTGDQPGTHSSSRVSHRLRNVGHVARGSLLGAVAVHLFLPEQVAFARAGCAEISGDRMRKPPLTHRHQLFAIRHRLPHCSLASVRTPLYG